MKLKQIEPFHPYFISLFTFIGVFIIIITSFISKSQNIDSQSFQINEIDTDENEQKVYIAVMSGAPLKDEIEYAYYNWYEKLLISGNCTGVGFYIDDYIKTINKEINYHIVIDENDISTHKLCSKLYAALEYFIYNTNSGWFLRLCEDTAINLETFPLFLSELNENFNPYIDTVIQGACLGKTNSTYIQGGSGFVFSRKAAIDLFNDFSWFRSMFFINKADDRVLGFYFQRIGLSPEDTTSRWFVGHGFRGRNSAIEAVTDLSGYIPCDEPVSKKGCRRFLTRVKDITFWHDRVKFSQFAMQVEAIRSLAADNLYFYVPINKPVICLGTNKTVSKYY